MNATIHKGTNKKIVVNTLVLYIRVFIVLFLSLFSTRFVLEGLGEVNFGIYNLIAGIVTLFSFISATLAGVTQRFLSYEIGATQDIERVNIVFNTSVRLHILAAIIVIIIVIVGGLFLIQYVLNIPSESIPVSRLVLICVGIGLAATIIGVPYEAALMAHENIIYVVIIQLGSTLLKFSAAILVIYLRRNQLLIYSVIMAGVPFIITIAEFLYTKTKYPETKYRIIPFRHNPVRREMQQFAGLSIWGNLGWAIRSQGVSIFLNIFWGVTVNAANGIANQVNGALLSLSSSLTTSIRPQLVQSAGEGSYHRMLALAVGACKYPLMLLTLVGIPIFVAMPIVLQIWLKEVPDYAVMFCRFLVVELIINQSTYGMALILDATGEIKHLHLIVGSSLLITTLCAYFAGLIFNVPSALYWCIIINGIFIGIIRVVLVNKKMKILSKSISMKKVFLISILKPLFFTLSLTVLGEILWSFISHNIVGLVVFSMVSMIGCGVTYFFFIFNRDEKEKIKTTIVKILHKL